MITQLERFDLCDLEPGFNIGIVGVACHDNAILKNTISHILETKLKGLGIFKVFSDYKRIKRYTYTDGNQLKEFEIAKLHPKRWESNNYDIIFVHSLFKHKIKVINKCNIISDMIEYSSLDDFFLVQNGTIKICSPEYRATYLINYNENPFSYNNVMTLNKNISNGFSVYFKINGFLYNSLQTRLKEIDIIYFAILCLKNNVDENIWLPNELHLEIINLFCLLCLQ